jgi:hypothetical protein
MKKAFIVFIIFLSVCLNFVACENQSQQINLNASNINEYVNIQLVFGNVEENTYTEVVSQEQVNYLSCVCYVIVTPKSNYNFTNAKITLGIKKGLFSETDAWSPKVYSIYTTVKDSGECTVQLDKNGYGVSSIYFEKKGATLIGMQNVANHPLTDTQWSTTIKSASGSITKH